MWFVVGIVLLICFVFIWALTRTRAPRTCSDIDKRCYETSSTFTNQQDAADALARVNLFLQQVIAELAARYNGAQSSTLMRAIANPREFQRRQRVVKNLLRRYNPNVLAENVPVSTQNTSYTDGKGTRLAFCLRNSGSLEDMDALKFVALHELAHIGCDEYGHGPEFWRVFKFLLQEAELAKLYTPVDYAKTPINYCKLDVTYNPYFDPEVVF